MSIFNEKLIHTIKNKHLQQYLLNCNFGLERENARVDKHGTLAFTPHPKAFGDRLKNPNIKTDFCESQIELVTPVCRTIEETYNSLEKLHEEACKELKDEYLWTQSNPPYLPKDKEIPIAKMGNKNEDKYRAVLAKKYGKKKQLISGIHYNFSFNENFVKIIYEELSIEESFRQFKDNLYLKICRNFMKYRWLIIYLTGATPVFHNSFIKKYVDKSRKLDEESCYFTNMISLRNSDYGYKNKENFYASLDSVDKYIKDIETLIYRGELQDICEFYGPIRLKTGNNDHLSEELIRDGIKYIEVRILDINPLCKVGINKDSLNFVHLFLVYMLLKEDGHFDKEDHVISNKNAHNVSLFGREPGFELYEKNGEKVPLKSKSQEIIKEIKEMIKLLGLDSDKFSRIINKAENMIASPNNTFAAKVFEGVKEKSYIDFHLDKAKEYH